MLKELINDDLGTAYWSSPEWLSLKRRFKAGTFFTGRDPLDYSVPIGSPLPRHAFLCADTRTGKGRSIILNNGALWPGSYVNVTPKPEDAEILAARRGAGDERCDGLGQDVFILDPFHAADVDPALRGFWEPMDMVDPKDPVRTSRRMMRSMCIQPEGNDGKDWQRKGATFAAAVAAHLKTSPHYEDHERRSIDLRRMILEGKGDDYREFCELHAAGEIPADNMPRDGYELLFTEMKQNKAARGRIASIAASYEARWRSHPEGWESIKDNAVEITDWLDSEEMQDHLAGVGMDASRRLDIDRIKTDPKGVSVFIVLPTDERTECAPWQRMLIETMLKRFQRIPGNKGANGHKILFSVDEFLSYGRMESLENGMTEIAGAGVALFLAVQKIGPLKKIYKESWETFASGAGLSIWFGLDEHDGAASYVSRLVGERTIRSITRTLSKGTTNTWQTAIAKGTSHQTNTGWNENESRGGNTQRNWSSGGQSGWNDGRQSGHSTRGGNLIDILPSHNAGSSHGRSGGRNWQRGGSEGENWNASAGRSGGESFGNQYTETSSEGGSTQDTQGIGEQVAKRPLLPTDVARIAFADRSDDPDDPFHPGLALIIEAKCPPYVVRKSFYDMDPLFQRKFTPNRQFRFLPVRAQPMLEYMYSKEHLFGFKLPVEAKAQGYALRPLLSGPDNATAEKGQPIFELIGPPSTDGRDPSRESIATIPAPCPVRIVGQLDRPGVELSLVLQKRTRGRLPARPCAALNRELIRKASDHRGRIERQEAFEKAEARRRERETIEAAEAAKWHNQIKRVIGRTVTAIGKVVIE